MKLLVLGGSVFLSRAVAEEAVRRGHDVVCACRGSSGSLPDGTRHVVLDRDADDPAAVLDGDFDAVVDVARHPSRVRSAVAALPDAHWIFVSTINVYPDNTTPGGHPGNLALLDPIETDEDPATGPDVYGAMKVACEQIVTDGAATSMVIRPGLIVGPDDRSGRYTYWPARLADKAAGREVLAPGAPEDPVQIIDVRDLATWIVDSAEQRRTGIFDGVGPATTRGALLAETIKGLEADLDLTWVPQEFLVEQKVEPWSGPRSVPLWLPLPEYAGMLAHDADLPIAAGLRNRSLAETARDTLAWLRANPDAEVTGLTRDEEAELLAAWRERT
ncbi:epimerase [Nocardioides speluncae]|uniref:epimerase n=1 Tax=Nocardioides speluncae TaxID=2670337 RepID=UPI000D68FBB9|nr:epimerase [Nocardioides speluncae]